MLLRPPALQKDDIVYVLSTARAISMEEILPAIQLFESWGLHVNIGATIGKHDNQYAGTDTERLHDFQQAIDDEKVKAIFCARGGYGTVRMLDSINFTNLLRYPKWIIGFSDITYLHTQISNTLGIQTLHALMASTLATSTPEAIETLRKELFGEKNSFKIAAHPLNRIGNASGELIGGNLSILYSITGTLTNLNTYSKILFLEDLDEYLYHIDRMMLNLKRAGKLKDLAGLVIGGFTDMKDNTVPFGKTAEEIIAEHVSQYNYPVCFNFPAGHIADNRALVMGRKYRLEVGSGEVLFE